MNKIFYILILMFTINSIYSRDRVDLASYSPYLLPDQAHNSYFMLFKRIRERYQLNASYSPYNYIDNFKNDEPNLKKIIFFDYCEDPAIVKLPKSKLVLFKWEAIKILDRYYKHYSRVYTFDDDLIDNKKFFKFYYPVLVPMIEKIPSFSEKKLCTMIVGNWLKDRISILDFFLTLPKGEFEFYGRSYPNKKYAELYKGAIPGHYEGPEKINILKNYKFSFCFENTYTTPGYITEKIFSCFAAGCVPIYKGPANTTNYIPKNCFINFFNFKSNEELYTYIKNMTEETYSKFIDNIKKFLNSKEAYLFSPDYFDQILLEAVEFS